MKRAADDNSIRCLRPRKRRRLDERCEHRDLVWDIYRLIASHLTNPLDYYAYAQSCSTLTALLINTPCESEMRKKHFATYERVRCNPVDILTLIHPTYDLWRIAIKRDGLLLGDYLDTRNRVTTEMKMLAVKNNGLAIEHINTWCQTMAIRRAAVAQNPKALRFIWKQTPKLCLSAVSRRGRAIKYVRQTTLEIRLAAVQNDGLALEYIPEKLQTDELCLIAVKQNGLAMRFANILSYEICLAGIQQINSLPHIKFDLVHLKSYYHDLCMDAYLIAVQAYPELLEYVKPWYQTMEIRMAAVTKNGWALQFVHKQTRKVCLAAIENYAGALEYVENQTLELCMAAAALYGRWVIQFIKDPIIKAQVLASLV